MIRSSMACSQDLIYVSACYCASAHFGSGIGNEGVTFRAHPRHCLVTHKLHCGTPTYHDSHASDALVCMAVHVLYSHNHASMIQFTSLQPALSWSLLARMIRIWQMSGQELPAVSMEEISEVRDLEGFTSQSSRLPDSTKLDAPIDLQLVLRALSTEERRVEAANELLRTCAQGDLKMARLILEAGAAKNAQNPAGNTALMLTASNGHVEFARLLLKAGAHKNLQRVDGSTALMFAARMGHVEMARLILEAGADKDLQEALRPHSPRSRSWDGSRGDRAATSGRWCWQRCAGVLHGRHARSSEWQGGDRTAASGGWCSQEPAAC